MNKTFLNFAFAAMMSVIASSCIDKNVFADEDAKPNWLGESIYKELQNPSEQAGLKGSFKYYLRLIDDLGYHETLSRTGSKTIFPANDEAFDKFFASGTWQGVSCYDNLSIAQKKMLLYGSMLDNALLVEMLSNATNSDKTSVSDGRSVKHVTALSAIDSVAYYSASGYQKDYPGNTFFEQTMASEPTGIHLVSDGTTPMMVHFTENYMLNQGISTLGANSDFSILTGHDYQSGDTYIYRNRVVTSDVACQNGYIHQVEDVIVPPGNMACVVANTSELSLFKRMLNRFAVPVYNASLTASYADWYRQQYGKTINYPIYEVHYLSDNSYNGPFSSFRIGSDESVPSQTVAEENLLAFDPGWNEYFEKDPNTSADTRLSDLGVLLAPNNDAVVDYFITNSESRSIMDRYAKFPNDREHIEKNLDCLPLDVLAPLIRNLMKPKLTDAVPSKFATVVDDAADFMGLSTSDIASSSNGSYDIHIANNGVVYVTNKVLGPKSYVCVSAPSLFDHSMEVIKWIINNHTFLQRGSVSNPYSLDLDFYAYLLAMSANFGMMLPTQAAFDGYCIDPASLYYDETTRRYPRARAFRFTPGTTVLGCEVYDYNPTTGAVSNGRTFDLTKSVNFAQVKPLLTDIVNYSTVTLANGEKMGSNRFYKTKHGGEIMIKSNGNLGEGDEVLGGAQREGLAKAAIINKVYQQENGIAYTVNHLVQGPMKSVWRVLSEDKNFSKFLELCEGFTSGNEANEALMEWAGITSDTEKENFRVFYKPGDDATSDVQRNRCLDYNVKFFKSYNYTVYAPTNAAMDIAFAHGLASWADIRALKAQGTAAAKASAYKKLVAMRAFIRYHFQNISLYADNHIDGGNYVSLLTNSKGVNYTLSVTGSNGTLEIIDESNLKHVIKASSAESNIMARDMELNANAMPSSQYTPATRVTSQSFAVVHGISEPLYYQANRKF